jgi:hypothetical protein
MGTEDLRQECVRTAALVVSDPSRLIEVAEEIRAYIESGSIRECPDLESASNRRPLSIPSSRERVA